MNTELHVYTASGQTLAHALKAFATKRPELGGVALLCSANEYFFAMLGQDGTLVRSTGQPVDLAPVYEARVFHPTAELRWWNDPSPAGSHRTVVLTEERWTEAENHGLHQDCSDVPFRPPIVGTLDQTYLLWGTGVEGAAGLVPGWGALATPRIGRLDVPIAPVRAEDRVELHAIEYLAEYEDGNIAILEERLTRLEVLPCQKEK